ncbi:cyanophycinase [Rheinheimera maricola]|uniref:Cyanophycinase n=1 Tax=Rheinheimera maricola TaxID=2793282 RepID=A0ABS7XBR4_9GAMM|nr:cyanophycinase [Rheinheimera maricola]MBZ9612614.1 cyanophycinase [Rheinheimera maricola]
MRSLRLYLSITLLACSAQAASVADGVTYPDYSMVLVGGGLKTCGSMTPQHCIEPGVFSDRAKAAELFELSTNHLANVGSVEFWGAERVIEQQQTLALLEFIRSRVASERITERELTRLWRAAEIEMDGIWVSGRVNYAALTERELNFVFDQLQVMVTADKANKSPNARLKEYADLTKSKDAFSIEVYRKVVELAAQVAGSQRKPRILVVTASGRDPFAAVDFYTNLFSEAGAEVNWLPLNAAYQHAQQKKIDGKASCDNLPQYLAQTHGAYQRSRVYPDLMQQLQRFCQQGTEGALEQIRRADAIFFNGGDQSLTLQALRLEDGAASEELKQIERMLASGQIIVAGTSAGTAVMSGGSFVGRRTPMITNGDSYNAMQFGAFDLPAPQPGCDKDQSCSNGLAENHLTFASQGGLGLFNWGVLDTHFSERGRQGRLIRLLNDTQTRFGFGVDEATALLVGFSSEENAPEVKMEVLGAAGVFVVDSQQAQNSGEGSVSAIKQVSTHYLTRGDSMEIKAGVLRTRFAAWKFAPNNMQAPMLTSGELFERDNYKQLAHLACLTQSRQADGKAVKVGQGHQIRLYKDHSSYARQGVYRLPDREIQYCSYRNLMVDIQPLQ